jgi:aminoglycoside phosphotransferase (APT) family kinase protein
MGSSLKTRAAPAEVKTSTMADVASLTMEPACAALLERRTATRSRGAYTARAQSEVEDLLAKFLSHERPGHSVGGVQRMGGGASKEQFIFTLTAPDGAAQKYVLRMDPLGAITETDRLREYEVLRAVQSFTPAPRPVWIDVDGSHFGQPAVIMEFVGGVTKPKGSGIKVSGLGTHLGEPLRSRLKGQFLEHLVALHGMDWRAAELPSFSAPTGHPTQAALWTVNYWKGLWRLDRHEDRPIAALAEQWLLDNLPDCDELVLTHGDYRTGNYLFDEESGRITALLDWELARIGDRHEDLAWVLMQVFGTAEDGVFRASDLFEREAFITAYEAASGRSVNRQTLHFYEVLSAWKCLIIVGANGLAAARAQQNHQDVLLTFLAATTAIFADDLCRLLSEGERS